jgi:hypothetical protein
MKRVFFYLTLALTLWIFNPGVTKGQNFSFGNGPIPIGDTTCFTANVCCLGFLEPPGWGWGYFLSSITINITTNHPQTLAIWIVSPSNDTLMLSEFNGAGGANYTNTNFVNWTATNIDGQAAPFTGDWQPEGGPLSIFDYTSADGIWTLCIADTAVVDTSGGGAGGGPWTPGYFGGASGGATIAFGTNAPPCPWNLPNWQSYLCPGETVDIINFYNPGGWKRSRILSGGGMGLQWMFLFSTILCVFRTTR